MRVKSDCGQFDASQCKKNIVRRLGGRKETGERIQHKYCPRPNPWCGSRSLAQQNASPTIAWSSFLKREDSSTTTTINQPPLPTTVSLRSSYHLHREPTITTTTINRERSSSPPSRWSPSRRKLIKRAERTVHECSGRKRILREAGRERTGWRTLVTWRALLPLVLLKNEGEFTARVGRVKIYCPRPDVGRSSSRWFSRCTGRGGKIPPKIE